MKHTYWLQPCLAAPPPNECTWSHPKNFDADCTTSYVLNSGVTEQNLTKFLQDVQRWLLITLLKSKLRSSNPFRNASVPNGRRSSNCGSVAAKIPNSFLKVRSYWTDLHQVFTHCRSFSAAIINACIPKAIVHSVPECQSKEWKQSISTYAKRP